MIARELSEVYEAVASEVRIRNIVCGRPCCYSDDEIKVHSFMSLLST